MAKRTDDKNTISITDHIAAAQACGLALAVRAAKVEQAVGERGSMAAITGTQADILGHLAACTGRRATLATWASRSQQAYEAAQDFEGVVIDADLEDGQHRVVADLCRGALEAVELTRSAHEVTRNRVSDMAREHLYAEAGEALEDIAELVRQVVAGLPQPEPEKPMRSPAVEATLAAVQTAAIETVLASPENGACGGLGGPGDTGMPVDGLSLPSWLWAGQDGVANLVLAAEFGSEINNLQHANQDGGWDLTAEEDKALRAAWSRAGGSGLAYSLEGVAGEVVAMPGTTAEVHRARETGVLLAQPSSTPQPMHSMVYSLQGGRVGSAPLARYRLPADMRDDILIMPGDVPSTAVASLDYLAVLADRMAPWVKVHCVPKGLTRMGDWNDFGTWGTRWHVGGQDYAAWGGLACSRHKLAFVAMSTEAKMASTLCHELMHIVWRTCLNDRAIEVLTEAVGAGHAWQGSYLASIEERVCRLFQAYCEGRMEGLPGAAMDMSAAGIMEMVWSGKLADHQIKQGNVPDAELHRFRRGLPAPVVEVAKPVRVVREMDWADKVIRAAAWLLGPTDGLRAA